MQARITGLTTRASCLQYCITEVWSVPYVGTVVDGILNAGRLKVGDAILFGPDSNGKFESTMIKSIQRKRCFHFSFVLS